jgi:hypothetical protein
MKDKALTENELKELDRLLVALESHIGNPFCIVYPFVHDGFQIAIYDRSRGDIIKKVASYDLISTLSKLEQP